jgi:Core binding factor beta subunit
MNGVCVRWKGWVDLERLDGVGCLEYDEDKAQVRFRPNSFYVPLLSRRNLIQKGQQFTLLADLMSYTLSPHDANLIVHVDAIHEIYI